MAATVLHLLIILLAFSHLISLDAVPIARTRNLLNEVQGVGTSENTNKATTEKTWDEELINRKMDLESNDYPGSGANNRHTPKPPLGRG